MSSNTGYRRSPRLKDFDYRGPLTAHLVMVTRNREPIFSDTESAQIALEKLSTTCAKFEATLHAYCFMPDHAHLLVSVDEGVSLPEFVRMFKQTSGFALKRKLGHEAWQISYYDHVLRREEAMEDVANYIWCNSVAGGLVKSTTDYSLSGRRPRKVCSSTERADLERSAATGQVGKDRRRKPC